MTMPALPRVLRIPSVLLLAGLLALLLDPASARAEKMLPDTELSGSAYRSFELIAPVPDFCRKVCEKDTGCQAWMFSWPGKKGKRAKCFLYSAVEGKREDTCCIAGYKSKGSSFGETIARWFGGEEEQGKPQAGAGADGKEPARSLPEMPVPVARKQPLWPIRPTWSASGNSVPITPTRPLRPTARRAISAAAFAAVFGVRAAADTSTGA